MLNGEHGDPEEGQPPLSRTLSAAQVVEAQLVAQKMAQRVAKRAAAKWVKKIKESAETTNYLDSVQFAEAEAFGSRAVGGHRPDDEVMYGTIES
eukprot:COSAG02_NODE_38197_length_432_cov_0.699700_1_plen_93_part_01